MMFHFLLSFCNVDDLQSRTSQAQQNKGESVRNSKCLKPYKIMTGFDESKEERRRWVWVKREARQKWGIITTRRFIHPITCSCFKRSRATTYLNSREEEERERERERERKRVWGWDEILFGTFFKVFCPLALKLRLLFSSEEMRLWWFSSSCLTFSLHILDSKKRTSLLFLSHEELRTRS